MDEPSKDMDIQEAELQPSWKMDNNLASGESDPLADVALAWKSLWKAKEVLQRIENKFYHQTWSCAKSQAARRKLWHEKSFGGERKREETPLNEGTPLNEEKSHEIPPACRKGNGVALCPAWPQTCSLQSPSVSSGPSRMTSLSPRGHSHSAPCSPARREAADGEGTAGTWSPAKSPHRPRRDGFRGQADSRGHTVQKEKSPFSLCHPPHRPFSAVPRGSQSNDPVPTALLLPTYHLSSTNKPGHHKLEELWKRSPQNKLEQLKKRIQEQKQKQRAASQEQQHLPSARAKEPLQKRPMKRKVCRVVSAPPAPVHRDRRDRNSAQRIQTQSQRQPSPKSSVLERAATGKGRKLPGASAWREGQKLARKLLGPPPTFPNLRSMAEEQTTAHTFEPGKGFAAMTGMENSSREKENEPVGKSPEFKSCMVPCSKPVERGRSAPAKGRKQILRNLHLQSQYHDEHRHTRLSKDTEKGKAEVLHQNLGTQSASPGPWVITPSAFTGGKIRSSVMKDGAKPSSSGNCSRGENTSPQRQKGSSSPAQKGPEKENLKHPSERKVNIRKPHPYSSKIVQEFMHRKNEERKKKSLQEKKSLVRAMEMRNKRLQEVYRKQKEAVGKKTCSEQMCKLLWETAPVKESPECKLEQEQTGGTLERSFMAWVDKTSCTLLSKDHRGRNQLLETLQSPEKREALASPAPLESNCWFLSPLRCEDLRACSPPSLQAPPPSFFLPQEDAKPYSKDSSSGLSPYRSKQGRVKAIHSLSEELVEKIEMATKRLTAASWVKGSAHKTPTETTLDLYNESSSVSEPATSKDEQDRTMTIQMLLDDPDPDELPVSSGKDFHGLESSLVDGTEGETTLDRQKETPTALPGGTAASKELLWIIHSSGQRPLNPGGDPSNVSQGFPVNKGIEVDMSLSHEKPITSPASPSHQFLASSLQRELTAQRNRCWCGTILKAQNREEIATQTPRASLRTPDSLRSQLSGAETHYDAFEQDFGEVDSHYTALEEKHRSHLNNLRQMSLLLAHKLKVHQLQQKEQLMVLREKAKLEVQESQRFLSDLLHHSSEECHYPSVPRLDHVEQTWSGRRLEGDNRAGSNQEMHSLKQSTLKMEGDHSPVDPKIAGEGEDLGRRGSYCSVLQGSLSAKHNWQTSDPLSPPANHPHREACAGADSGTSSEGTSSSSISQWSEVGRHYGGSSTFCSFSLAMVEQCLRGEELRARHQDALLKLREKALQEKARAELAWLGHQKRCLENLQDSKGASAMAAKQHKILMELKQEQAEIQHLQNIYRAAHQERKLLLKQQREILKMRHTTAQLQEKMHNLAGKQELLSQSLDVSLTRSPATEEGIKLKTMRLISSPKLYSSSAGSTAHPESPDLAGKREACVQLKNKQSKEYQGDKPAHRRTVNIGVGLEQTGPGGTHDVPKLWLCIDLSRVRVQSGNSALYPPCSFSTDNKKTLGRYQKLEEESPCLEQSLGVQGPDASEIVAKKVCCDTGQTTGSVFKTKDCKNTELNAQDHVSLPLEHTHSARMEEPISTTMARQGRKCSFLESVNEKKALLTNPKTDPKDNEDIYPCDSKFTAKGLGVLSTLCNLCLVQAENTLQGTVEVETPVPYEICQVDGSHCFKHVDQISHEVSDEQLNLKAFSEGLTSTESLSKSNDFSLRGEGAKSDSSLPEFQKVSAVWIDISESSISDLELKLKNGEDTDVSIPEEFVYDNGDAFPNVSKETLIAISNGKGMLPSDHHYEHEVPKDDSTETSLHLQKYPGDVSDHGSTDDLLSSIPSDKANASKPKSADSSQSDKTAKGMDEPHPDASENYSRNKTSSQEITKCGKDAVATSSYSDDIYSPKISEQHKPDSTTSRVKKDVGINSLFVDHNRDLKGFPLTGSSKCLDSVTDQLRNAVSFPPDKDITGNKLLPCLSSINLPVSGGKNSHALLSNEKFTTSKLSTMSTYLSGTSEEVHRETSSSESLQRAATGKQCNTTTERQAIKEARKGLSSLSSKNQLFQAESCSSKCEDDTDFISDEGPPPTDEDTLSEIPSPVDQVLSYGSADLPSSSKKDLSFPSEDLPPPPLGADAMKNDDSTFTMDDFPSPPEQITVSETIQCMDEDISLKIDVLPPLPDNTVPEEFPFLNQEATGVFSPQDCSLSERSLVKEIPRVKEGLLEHQQEECETPLQGLELLPVSKPISSGQVSESPDFRMKQSKTYLALPKAEKDSDDPLLAFEIGDRVLVKQTQPGTLKFKGRTCFDSGHWAGVALDKAEGDNAGTYKGVKYFECAQHCGIFVRPDEISHLLGANENGSSSMGDEDSDSEDDEFFKRHYKYSEDKQGGGLPEQKAEDTNSAGGSEVKENQCRLQFGKGQKLLHSDQPKCNESLSKNNLTCLGSNKEKPQLTQIKQRILADMLPVKSETGNTDKVNTNKTICCLVEDHERNKLANDIASELCRKLLFDTLIAFSQTAQYKYKSAFEKDMLSYGKGLREDNQKQFLLKENSVAILSEQSAKVSDVLLCDFDMFSIHGCHTVAKRIVTKFVADAVKEYKKIKRKHGSEADKIFPLSSETSPTTLPLLIKILDAGVFGSSEDLDQPNSDQHMLMRQTPKQYLYKLDQWHSTPWKRIAEVPLVIPHYTSYVKKLSARAVEELWTPENIYSNFRRISVPKNFESDDLQGNDLEMESKRMYNQIIFDLTRELLCAEYQVPANPNTLPWMKEDLGSCCSRGRCGRSDIDDVKMFAQDEIIKIMNLEKNDLEMKRKFLNMTRYENCKRDRVDLILIQELHKEEPQWTYYAADELTVKMRVTEDIFDTLILDTIRVLNKIYLRKTCD